MIQFEEIRVKTPKREILLDVTNDINKIVRDSEIQEGVCRVFVELLAAPPRMPQYPF